MKSAALLSIAALFVAGCGASPHATAAPSAQASPYFDVRANAAIDEATFHARLAAARIVLLGEKHDDPEHHRLEADALRTIERAHRAALVVEMIGEDKQPALDAFLATQPASAAPLESALDWKGSHWPAWPLYAPIFQAAIDAKAPIVAGNPSQAAIHGAVHGGEVAALPALPDAEMTKLRDELRTVHCVELEDDMLDGMVAAQRLKDATMAERVRRAATATGAAVLVAGNGHVRNDHGVGWLLAKEGALSVGFVEVDPNAPRPYLPYDLVVLTQPAGDPDPCRRMREHGTMGAPR